MAGSSPSSRSSIFSYTLTTSLFILLFLCSVFLFTRRSLEPYLPSDPRAPTLLRSENPSDEPPDGGDGVSLASEPSSRRDSRAGDDVGVKPETEEGGDSNGDGSAVEAESGDGGDSRATDDFAVKPETEGGESRGGEVSVEGKEESDAKSVDMEVVEKMRGCDLYKGTWVKDDQYPLYQPGSCPYVDEAFDCQRNGRRDSDYLQWRWKPDDCDLPRFNATDFLARLRGKRLMLVGDSMNRNQFESMLCVLREGLSNKSSMYEVNGHKITKGRGYYVFKFEDYNCTVEFVRSHFLVKEGVRINAQGSSNPTLSIDQIDKTNARWKRADILVFNTGHWWVHGKTARGKNYYKEGDYIYPKFDATEAYRRALRTWAKWIDKNVKPDKKLVFYRGYSSAHFRGGEWDSGGSCNGEVEPVFKGSILDSYPLKMKIVEEAVKEMKVPVILLNVTKLTNFRKDGHPSIYGKTNTDGKKVSTKRQDCSHWCLPGVPDAWNHLIYSSLLLQTGSNRRT
ncbi:PREDICTED: protein trichome birefringence-like 5 [Tarenaya hassleriana]|uniref:protein trichome birefringence-like 5 n=1 Tax=Tarenaya hassleriana TaxID=28532 RepID=UPI00053C86B1|nr:PREDICTED: protein trichome birefringence-like 5 [Tarenaya hassleriana]